MKSIAFLLIAGLIGLMSCSKSSQNQDLSSEFPDELVHFQAYAGNPVFAGTGDSTNWDEQIRERGFILKEDSLYYMWYTGYTKKTGKKMKYLGLATSVDGLTWTRYAKNPIHTTLWVEDMFVLKSEGTYYMFAESRGDSTHLLVSSDKINWADQGALDIRLKNGNPIAAGAYGTPTVVKQGNVWNLLYEREDAAVWLAQSTDLKVWTNVQDEPVLNAGPESYDQFAVAMNQVIERNGLYYGYYHASAYKDWREWSCNVAVSKDLIHWTKYKNNPIIENNASSNFVVEDGDSLRMYSMHPNVRVYFPVLQK